MITEARFQEIRDEVQAAVKQLYDYCAANNQDSYILWLAEADVNSGLEAAGQNPYVLDSRMDYYKEMGRLEFSQFYLNKLYSFPEGTLQSVDHPFWLQLEMMIYSHVWESNKFLKQLFRLKEVAHGKNYAWVVPIPESGKHKFIRNAVKKGFKSKGLKIATVVERGFLSSLRNSFLHAEFEIDEDNSNIRLHTHRTGSKLSHEIDLISFDDWTERFLYSVLLNYFIITEKFNRKKTVREDFGKDEFLLVLPVARTRLKAIKIYYDESRESFSFTKSIPYVRRKIDGILPKEEETEQLHPLVAQDELEHIEHVVKTSVNGLLDLLCKTDSDKYICWLFDIKYDEATGKYTSCCTEDISRLNFSSTLLHGVYVENKVLLPEVVRIQMELMVYSHIWESKPLLYQLRGAARILAREPINSKEELDGDRRKLVDDIIAKFTSQNCSLAGIIDQSFHTSLRNAFAHSEYDIDQFNQLIRLDTYKEERSEWDIDNIGFAEWRMRFLFSVVIDFQVLIARAEARKTIRPQQVKELLDRVNLAKTSSSV